MRKVSRVDAEKVNEAITRPSCIHVDAVIVSLLPQAKIQFPDCLILRHRGIYPHYPRSYTRQTTHHDERSLCEPLR